MKTWKECRTEKKLEMPSCTEKALKRTEPDAAETKPPPAKRPNCEMAPTEKAADKAAQKKAEKEANKEAKKAAKKQAKKEAKKEAKKQMKETENNVPEPSEEPAAPTADGAAGGDAPAVVNGGDDRSESVDSAGADAPAVVVGGDDRSETVESAGGIGDREGGDKTAAPSGDDRVGGVESAGDIGEGGEQLAEDQDGDAKGEGAIPVHGVGAKADAGVLCRVKPAPAKRDTYVVKPEHREAVRIAQGPNDVPVGIRNTLYAAIGRHMAAAQDGKKDVSEGVLARYAEDKDDRSRMFGFLKEFVEDTSCMSMTVSERHTTIQSNWNNTEFGWFTKHELMITYKGYKHQDSCITS